MPRILRSQGIYKLFPPIAAAPAAVFVASPIQTRLVAVTTARKTAGRYPSEGWSSWVTQGDGVLDTFNRADENLVASPNWFQPLDTADTAALTVAGNQLSNPGAAFGSAFWNKNMFGPDCAVSVQQGTVPNQFYLYARMNNVNTVQLTGYALHFDFNTTQVRLLRVDGTSYVTIAAFTPIPGGFTTGDVLMLKIVGSTLTGYKNGVAVITAVDATYGAAGYIGIDLNNGFNVDNFGGGTLLISGRHRTPLVGIRPPMIVDETRLPGTPIRAITVAAGARRHPARKTIYRLNPPAVVAAAAVFVAPPQRIHTVTTRPRRTVWTLRKPTVLQVFAGPRSELTKTRPRRTTIDLRSAAVVLVPTVEQQERTLRVALVRTRPRPTTKQLRPTTVVLVNPPVVTEIRVTTVRGRRPKVIYRLFRPATLEPFSIQLREQTIRVGLVQIRPRKTTLKLRPPTKLAAVTFQAGKPTLVRVRPPRTVTTLRPPAVLRVFTTGEAALVRIRPRHTTTLLRPAVVVRVPSVEQQLRTLRVALVEARPRHTTTVRPPVVRYAPEVTTLRVVLAQTKPRPTTTVLRPPAIVQRPPEVTQIRVRLAERVTPHVRSILRPAAGEPFVAAPLRSVLTRIRPRHTVARLFVPAVVAEHVEPLARPILTALTAIARRLNQPHVRSRLAPPGPTRKKGRACLIDIPAAILCLDDAAAVLACLRDVLGAEACLTDVPEAAACLEDQSAANVKLCDQEV